MQQLSFSGKRVLVRVDFNVPLNDSFQITDDTRIRAAIPTIKTILDGGGSVVLMSHLGRPKGPGDAKNSLKHLVHHVSNLIGQEVHFAPDCIGAEAFALTAAMKPGMVVLLENLRFYAEEEKGDEDFAKKLSGHGDIYLNDAFGTAHRAHASTAVIAGFFKGRCGFGMVMQGELNSLKKVLSNPQRPFTAIMGGSKVSGKILIIEQLMDKINDLIIGGGMMFTFAKAMGGQVGKSLVEADKLALVEKILKLSEQKGVRLHLPVDTVAADAFSNEAQTLICPVTSIPENWMGLDIGPETCKVFRSVIMSSKTILWNGPMGVFELEKFAEGTRSIALDLAEVTEQGCYTLVGGGDSVAAINKYALSDRVSYVSTGGGAMLEYIESGSLPGVEAVNQNR